MRKARCCSCIPQGIFLISEDVALPQEEEGASCYRLCGLRAVGHFQHASAQLWERGTGLGFPGLGKWALPQEEGVSGWHHGVLGKPQGRDHTWDEGASSSQGRADFLKRSRALTWVSSLVCFSNSCLYKKHISEKSESQITSAHGNKDQVHCIKDYLTKLDSPM